MKTVNLIFIILLVTSCYSWEGEHVNGSGKVTRIVYNEKSFSTLNLEVVFHVILIPSDSEKVVVETDDNLQEYVKVENINNCLTIKMKSHVDISRKTSNKIYVYIKKLEEINNNSVGVLDNEGVIKSTKLVFNNKAVGKTMLKIEAEDLTIDNSSVGKMELSGNCNNLKIKNNSVGMFDAMGLQSNYLELNNNSVGKTTVYANKEIVINNNGIGSLDVYGNGVMKRISNNSLGSFQKH